MARRPGGRSRANRAHDFRRSACPGHVTIAACLLPVSDLDTVYLDARTLTGWLEVTPIAQPSVRDTPFKNFVAPPLQELERLVDPGMLTGSEDFGVLAASAQAPCVLSILGGADAAPFAAAKSQLGLMEVARAVPGNHSPLHAPVISPTLAIGVEALITAVGALLRLAGPSDPGRRAHS